MLRDPLGWVLHSPQRALAVGTAAIALVVLAASQLHGSPRDKSPAPDETTAPHAAASPQPSTSPLVQAKAAGSTRKVRRTALRFLDAYVVSPEGRTTRGVPNELKHRTTPALWHGLRLANPAALPQGKVTSVDIEEAGSTSAKVTARLDDGSSLELSVVAWTQGWRVSDVQPEDPT